MQEKDFFNQLKSGYFDLISDKYPFPSPYRGDREIRAIVLGADPTKIINQKDPVRFEKVFGLENENSPYWRGIRSNLEQISKDFEEHIYVQNVCRNYFTKETSNNKAWTEIARNHWIPFLAKELDELFDVEVPILMTTEFILHAALKDENKKYNAATIYRDNIAIFKEENLFGRELYALYRHQEYALSKKITYCDFLRSKLVN